MWGSLRLAPIMNAGHEPEPDVCLCPASLDLCSVIVFSSIIRSKDLDLCSVSSIIRSKGLN